MDQQIISVSDIYAATMAPADKKAPTQWFKKLPGYLIAAIFNVWSL